MESHNEMIHWTEVVELKMFLMDLKISSVPAGEFQFSIRSESDSSKSDSQ